jgi:pimeloyl-ACP methyl ester carboxylesterase
VAEVQGLANGGGRRTGGRRGAVVAAVAAVVALTASCSGSTSLTAEEGSAPPGTAGSGPVPSTPTSVGSATPNGTSGFQPTPVSWARCKAAEGPYGFDCATLQVPLDYGNPGGRTIGIALARHAATGTKIGSLVTNPGGPGVSGVDDLAYVVSILSPAVVEHFDVIAFDPRGVARSAPIECVSGPQLDRLLDVDPAPTTDAGFQALVDASRTFDQGCQARSGDLLPYVGTDNAARDMDEIRRALGDDKLTYFGFSYGTLLGATYAELFPDRVRAMVLDGAKDPAIDPITSDIDQSTAFDQELNAFFADCTAHSSCRWKPGGDLHAAFDALMTRIRAQPLRGDGKRTLGPGEAFYGVAYPLYDQAGWPVLADALAAAGRGDGSLLLRQFDEYFNRSPDGTYGNELNAYDAVTCLDEPWPRDLNVLRQAATVAKQRAPEFGVDDLYGGITCSVWPIPATRRPHRIRAAGSPPIVVIGSTGDPATPYTQAQALASELEHGVLITRVGDGHTGYRASACVRSNVDVYLTTLEVPPAGLTCPTP